MEPCSLRRAIPIVAHLTRDEFARDFQYRQPVIIKGLADNWTAFHNWSLAHLAARFGDRRVPARFFSAASDEYRYVTIKLSDYMRYLSVGDFSKQRLYVADWEISKDFKELVKEINVPALFQPDYLEKLPNYLQFGRVWIFIGHMAVHTSVHVDAFATSAFITQLHGQKHFRIAPPVELPKSLFENLPADQLIWDAILERGDTLYIPGGFPHEIRNIDVNIMVTKNFLEHDNVYTSLKLSAQKYQTMVDEILNLQNAFGG